MVKILMDQKSADHQKRRKKRRRIKRKHNEQISHS